MANLLFFKLFGFFHKEQLPNLFSLAKCVGKGVIKYEWGLFCFEKVLKKKSHSASAI